MLLKTTTQLLDISENKIFMIFNNNIFNKNKTFFDLTIFK